jgi:CTP:molybdopterin cytidylyltransferase MocA
LTARTAGMPVIVLLAAGEGRRFDGIKQLAELDGEPMCRHVATRLLALDCPLVVVTGAHAGAVERALDGLAIDLVRHEDWRRGLGSSIARAAHHVLQHHGAASGVLVCLADQPLIDAGHYRHLLFRHAEAPDRLLATRHGQVSGPPVLFPADCLPDLAAWTGSRGAHALLEREAARVEHVDVAEHLDVDTSDDLVQARLRQRPGG